MKLEQRLRPLDGLRGVAILLVIGFHYFFAFAASHPDLYPYGGLFGDVGIFRYGNLGVELFFIVSGFVIALTLESCKTATEFAARRFSRLWPPLAGCSLVTFMVISMSTTPFSLASHQEWQNFLPSLTFTNPNLWTWTSPQVRFVDLVYWSLVVEVRFYIIAGVLFAISADKFARNLIGFAVLDILGRWTCKKILAGSEVIFSDFLITDYLPWMVAGVIFYELYRQRIAARFAFVTLALILAYVSQNVIFTQGRSAVVVFCIGLSFFVVFWLLAREHPVVRVFSAPVLVWIGECSYSIYLLHFEVGMMAISAIPHNWRLATRIIAVAFIVATILVLGRLSFLLLEQSSKTLVMKLFRSVQMRFGGMERVTTTQ